MGVCRVACVWVKVFVCKLSRSSKIMFLQGAILFHTCSVPLIVLSFLSCLICRNATVHTYLVWFYRAKHPDWCLDWLNRLLGNHIRCVAVSWADLGRSAAFSLMSIMLNAETGHKGRRYFHCIPSYCVCFLSWFKLIGLICRFSVESEVMACY